MASRSSYLSTCLLLVVVAFSLSSRTSKAGLNYTSGYHGMIRSRVADSNLVVYYDFSPYGFNPDSVILWLPDQRVTVYSHQNESPEDAPDYFYRIDDGVLYLKDSAVFALDSTLSPSSFVQIIGYCGDTVDSTAAYSQWAPLYDNLTYLGFGMEWGGISYGFFRSNLKGALNDEGPFLGTGLSLGPVGPRWSFMLSTSWSEGKNFSFSEPFRGEFCWAPLANRAVGPELLAGGGLSKLKVKRDDFDFRRVKWGVDIGAAVKVPFHRLSYRYSTAAGGYHTVDLYVATSEDSRGGTGTRYQLQKHESLWTVRVSTHLSLHLFEETVTRGNSRRITRRDPRPWPLKVLSYAGDIPLAPYYLVAALVRK